MNRGIFDRETKKTFNNLGKFITSTYCVRYTPDSSTVSLVSSSLTTDAVKPTALDPFPDVYIPLGVILCTYDNNWLLLVPVQTVREYWSGVRMSREWKLLMKAFGEGIREKK